MSGRVMGWLTVFAVALGATIVLSLFVGSKAIPPGTVLDALFRFDPTDNDHLFVREDRLPRTLLGLLVGAGLGLAGTVMQAVARNPSPTPGCWGSTPVRLFVVTGITFFGMSGLSGYVWFAFAGAPAATVLVYGVGALGRDGRRALQRPVRRLRAG